MSEDIEIEKDMIPKIISVVLAIVVFAAVLVPIVDAVNNGGGNGGSGESNEEYVLSKMAYGTNPTFDITPNDDVNAIFQFIYQTPILYADDVTAIIRSPNEGDYILTIGNGYNLSYQNVSTISRIVSDGTSVTVYYSYNDSDLTEVFDISSPCYYADDNGKYGTYLNPGFLALMMQDAPEEFVFPEPFDDYEYLYVPNGYDPHITIPLAMYIMFAYDGAFVLGLSGDYTIRSFEPYYTVSNNKLTDAGWDVDMTVNHTTYNDPECCMVLIAPNSVGTSGGTSGNGMVNTLLSVLPVMVGIGIILAIVGMFYSEPSRIENGGNSKN